MTNKWEHMTIQEYLIFSISSMYVFLPLNAQGLLEFALNWTNNQHLIDWINFFWIVIVQIQTRHVRNHMGKENTTVIIFDHEGVKIMKKI